jgi:hypothetical protein
MIRKLPVSGTVAPPRPDETITSIVMRHAKAHAYPKTDWITDLCGLPLPALLYDADALTRLSTLVGLERSDLLRRSRCGVPPSVPGANFFGHAIDVDHFDRTPMRVCPKCIREEGYLKAIWELTLCRVCPVHGCLLLETCPNCERALEPNWPEPGVCAACRRAYGEHEATGHYPVVAAFWAKVQARLEGLVSDGGWMERLSLPALLDLAAVLQALKAPGVRASTMSQALRGVNADRSRRLVEGQEWCLALLNDWPRAFDAYCDQALHSSSPTELWERAIRRLHPILSWALPVELAALQDRVELRLAAKRGTILRSFLGDAYQPEDESRHLLVHEADTILGITSAATRELFDVTPLTPGPRSGSTRKRLVLTAARPVHGVLEDIVAHGVACAPDREYMSFEEASLALQAFNARRRALLAGMRCGDIDYFFEEGRRPHLGSARIAHDSFVEFFRNSLDLDLQQWIPLRDATFLAVLDPATMDHLRQKRHIIVRGEAGVPDRREVHLHSLLQFKQSSRVLARIGGAQDFGRQSLVSAATTLGVRLLAGPRVGGSTVVIRKADVGKIIASIRGV